MSSYPSTRPLTETVSPTRGASKSPSIRHAIPGRSMRVWPSTPLTTPVTLITSLRCDAARFGHRHIQRLGFHPLGCGFLRTIRRRLEVEEQTDAQNDKGGKEKTSFGGHNAADFEANVPLAEASSLLPTSALYISLTNHVTLNSAQPHTETKVYSLSQVARSIRKALERATANKSWLVKAEILSISKGIGKKTVYLDLVEEAEGRQNAKMRGIIWAGAGREILGELGDEAAQILKPGSKSCFPRASNSTNATAWPCTSTD